MPVYSSGTMIADRYKIVQGPHEKRSLMGGMGIVYFCFDHREQRPVALKTFRPELLPNRSARDRFLREATTWVNLGNHPHIVRAYNAERIDNKGEIYLILELVAKEESRVDASLRSWLALNSSLPVEQTLLFGWQIVRGLRHATSVFPGLVHRDLKPENVLVGADRLPDLNVNRVRVTDFGLANVLLTNHHQQLALTGQQEQPGSLDIKRTQLTKGIVGTPLYMAPEQWRGENLDMRTDVYAFGCILYEMLTGQYAVAGVTLYDLSQAHQQGKIQPLPAKLPQNVVDIVLRCLAVKAGDRYNSWIDIEVALSQAYKTITKLDISEIESSQAPYRLEQVGLGWSYSALGASYLDISNAKVAINYYERTQQIGQAENDQLLVGAGLTGLGLAYRELGHLLLAVEKFEQALRIANLVGDQSAEGAVLNNLGICYRHLGKLDEALECHERRLALAQALNDQAGIGNALSGLGFIYMERGRPDVAVDYHQKQLTIARALEDSIGQSGALLNLGICYFQLSRISEAERYYQQAVELARQIGESRAEVRALAGLGQCYLQADLQAAIDYSKQALALARSINDNVTVSGILGVLAVASYRQQQWKEAEAMWQESLEISDQIGTIGTSAGICLALANLMLQQGRLSKSLSLAERALEVFLRQGAPGQIQHTQQLVLHIQRMMQQLK